MIYNEKLINMTKNCTVKCDHAKNNLNSRIKNIKPKFYRLAHEIYAMYFCLARHKS